MGSTGDKRQNRYKKPLQVEGGMSAMSITCVTPIKLLRAALRLCLEKKMLKAKYLKKILLCNFNGYNN